MTGQDVKLLKADDAGDRSMWLAAWRECGREPFAHPAYVELFAGSPGEQARCLVARSDAGTAILPLVLRPIHHSVRGLRPRLQDAISPYGYGGPYGATNGSTVRVWSLLADWMRGEGVVSMFARLALDANRPTDLPVDAVVRTTAENIVVDLTRPEAEQWFHYEHKVRKNVKKALHAELSVTIQPQFADLAEFVALYHETMSRRDASSFYRFDHAFFEKVQGELSENCIAAEVRDCTGRLVSAELVLTSDRFLYSYLGGTQENAFPARPNDLLKHEVINYGRGTGRRGYVLGGGYSAGDGIFRYKRSFDPTGSVPFRTLRLIADQHAYALLTRSHLGPRPSDDEDEDEGFFPAYRAPVDGGDQARQAPPSDLVVQDGRQEHGERRPHG